jgi:MFS family permease
VVVGAAKRSSDVLSLGSFVVLGLPDGMLGTVWPSMRLTFGAPIGALGLVLLLATIGSVLVNAFVGRLIRRLAVPALRRYPDHAPPREPPASRSPRGSGSYWARPPCGVPRPG